MYFPVQLLLHVHSHLPLVLKASRVDEDSGWKEALAIRLLTPGASSLPDLAMRTPVQGGHVFWE